VLKQYNLIDRKVCEAKDNDCPIKIYIAPTEEEKKYLIEHYLIDEHTLASALDPDELSRFEIEPNHLALIYKRPKNYSAKDQLLFKTHTIGLFYFKDYVIFIMNEDVNVFDGKQFNKVASLNELVLKLIFRAIIHFTEHLKVMNMISSELEQKINRAMENKYLLNMFTLEKSLVYYLNAINSNGVLIEKVKLNSAKFNFNTDEVELLDDIVIENNQCYKQAEIYSNILASLMDARASIVSNNLNILIKVLNIITIGLMVPTLIVSIFSMNVKLPIFQEHPLSFWFVLGISAFSSLIVFVVWRALKL
jgi:magnesium transporter